MCIHSDTLSNTFGGIRRDSFALSNKNSFIGPKCSWATVFVYEEFIVPIKLAVVSLLCVEFTFECYTIYTYMNGD